MRLDEDIIRFLTIKIKHVDEKPSPLIHNKSDNSKNDLITNESYLETVKE